MFEHGLNEGDRLRSKRRPSELVVHEVRDTTVHFGPEVGEQTHKWVTSGLESGELEKVSLTDKDQ